MLGFRKEREDPKYRFGGHEVRSTEESVPSHRTEE